MNPCMCKLEERWLFYIDIHIYINVYIHITNMYIYIYTRCTVCVYNILILYRITGLSCMRLNTTRLNTTIFL